jgi:hypothetical protein
VPTDARHSGGLSDIVSGRKHREKISAWQAAEERKAALATPRDYRESILLRGIGPLEIQIARLPSFEPAQIWDFRRDPVSNTLRLYTACSHEVGSRQVVGYEEVHVDQAVLVKLVSELMNLVVPVHEPRLDRALIADGTVLEVSFAGPTARCSFQWVEGSAPATWAPLEARVLDAIRLSNAAPRETV